MQRNMLQAKLHRVSTTQTEVGYEGSVAIDRTLMDAADIREFQAIDIYNIDNGVLIICTYSQYDEAEVERHDPHLIYVDEKNIITHTHNGCTDKLECVV